MIHLLLLLLTIATVTKSASVLEPSTKVAFENVSKDSEGKKLSLAGVGVRIKQIGPLAVKIYAAGLYVDKPTAAIKAKALGFKTQSDLLKSKSFSDLLVKSPFEKSVVLKMVRSVTGKKMTDSITEAIRPRLKSKDTTVLDSFSKILSNSLKEGLTSSTVISFRTAANKSLTIGVDGQRKGTVNSSDLCEALLDVYLGDKPVSPQLRQDISKNIFEWCK